MLDGMRNQRERETQVPYPSSLKLPTVGKKRLFGGDEKLN